MVILEAEGGPDDGPDAGEDVGSHVDVRLELGHPRVLHGVKENLHLVPHGKDGEYIPEKDAATTVWGFFHCQRHKHEIEMKFTPGKTVRRA